MLSRRLWECECEITCKHTERDRLMIYSQQQLLSLRGGCEKCKIYENNHAYMNTPRDSQKKRNILRIG